MERPSPTQSLVLAMNRFIQHVKVTYFRSRLSRTYVELPDWSCTDHRSILLWRRRSARLRALGVDSANARAAWIASRESTWITKRTHSLLLLCLHLKSLCLCPLEDLLEVTCSRCSCSTSGSSSLVPTGTVGEKSIPEAIASVNTVLLLQLVLHLCLKVDHPSYLDLFEVLLISLNSIVNVV
jgi:hypothetical protein